MDIPIRKRELLIAFFTGAVMGVISYLIIRHIEGYVRHKVDGHMRAVGI